ncbi:hypothetical protein B5F44_11035 [Gordonibacter urolithinfaciens]|nr:hypothetical protein B5F44_11035 [Gordonibacter urolithinfaciens]
MPYLQGNRGGYRALPARDHARAARGAHAHDPGGVCKMTQLGLVVSLDRCMDTRGCMGACKQENNVDLGAFWVRTYTSTTGGFPDAETYFIPVMCQHCRKPSCVPACPEQAIRKREDGIVVIDTAPCAACGGKECMDACPYGAISYNERDNTVGKCDMCASRVDQGLAPACAFACNSNAWMFGDVDDPESGISQVLAAMGDSVHQLKLETGNEPSCYYLLSSKRWQDMDGLRAR